MKKIKTEDCMRSWRRLAMFEKTILESNKKLYTKEFLFKTKKAAFSFATDLCDFIEDFDVHRDGDKVYRIDVPIELFEELCNDEKFREAVVIHCAE